jgi:hypothetical protein
VIIIQGKDCWEGKICLSLPEEGKVPNSLVIIIQGKDCLEGKICLSLPEEGKVPNSLNDYYSR